MPFDAGMLRCVVREIDPILRGGKVEKIYMPQKDTVVLSIKNGREAYRLLINAGPSSPRLCITGEKTENPAVPPMLCMMLRKHLSGAILTEISQLGFERAVRAISLAAPVRRLAFDVVTCINKRNLPELPALLAPVQGL